MTYSVKDWQRFQHYNNRNPPWIKLYKTILDDMEWAALSGDASKLLVECWLLASRLSTKEGLLGGLDEICWHLRRPPEETAPLLEVLVASGFILASNMLADCSQDASPRARVRDRDRDRGRDARENGKVKPKRKRATPTVLPDDWAPTDEHRTRAAELGVDLGREAAKFRSHAEANAREAVSWNAAFTTWLLKAPEYRGPNGSGPRRASGALVRPNLHHVQP